MTPKSNGNVQSVQRALRLLALFAPHRTEMAPRRTTWTITNLARASGLHKSVVARLMATMAREGFVVQDPVSKAYRIGPQAFAVGNAYEPHNVLDNVARPVMEELTARCGHASYLGVLAGSYYVVVVAVESINSIRVTIELGESRNLHTGAIGKVLLAGLTDAEICRLLGPGPLPPITPHTTTSVAALLEEIARVRQTGIAYNREEAILGVGSVAVGITDGRGETAAGLGIVYPTHVVSDNDVQELGRIVADAGVAISRRLGALEDPARTALE
jgi:IclR family acetate operon transcriptional repressor